MDFKSEGTCKYSDLTITFGKNDPGVSQRKTPRKGPDPIAKLEAERNAKLKSKQVIDDYIKFFHMEEERCHNCGKYMNSVFGVENPSCATCWNLMERIPEHNDILADLIKYPIDKYKCLEIFNSYHADSAERNLSFVRDLKAYIMIRTLIRIVHNDKRCLSEEFEGQTAMTLLNNGCTSTFEAMSVDNNRWYTDETTNYLNEDSDVCDYVGCTFFDRLEGAQFRFEIRTDDIDNVEAPERKIMVINVGNVPAEQVRCDNVYFIDMRLMAYPFEEQNVYYGLCELNTIIDNMARHRGSVYAKFCDNVERSLTLNEDAKREAPEYRRIRRLKERNYYATDDEIREIIRKEDAIKQAIIAPVREEKKPIATKIEPRVTVLTEQEEKLSSELKLMLEVHDQRMREIQERHKRNEENQYPIHDDMFPYYDILDPEPVINPNNYTEIGLRYFRMHCPVRTGDYDQMRDRIFGNLTQYVTYDTYNATNDIEFSFQLISDFIDIFCGTSVKECMYCTKNISSHIYGHCCECYLYDDNQIRSAVSDVMHNIVYCIVRLFEIDEIGNDEIGNIIVPILENIIANHDTRKNYDETSDPVLASYRKRTRSKQIRFLKLFKEKINTKEKYALMDYRVNRDWNYFFSALFVEKQFHQEYNLTTFKYENYIARGRCTDFGGAIKTDNMKYKLGMRIEVDEAAHKTGAQQFIADKTKNYFCDLYGLKMIRIDTSGLTNDGEKNILLIENLYNIFISDFESLIY